MIEKLNTIVIGEIKFGGVCSQEMQPTNEKLMWKLNQVIDKVNELDEKLNLDTLQKNDNMASQEYGEYLHSLFLKDEICFGQAINMAKARGKEEMAKAVIQFLKINLTPFDWCIGHTQTEERVMNTEKFIQDLKRAVDYYGE